MLGLDRELQYRADGLVSLTHARCAEPFAFKADRASHGHSCGPHLQGVKPHISHCCRQLTVDIWDNFEDALNSAGFVQSWPVGQRNKEQLTNFLMSLPSRPTAAMIQFHYLKDVDRDWDINDLRDVFALATARPYSDVVVTDRKGMGRREKPSAPGRRVRHRNLLDP